MAVHLHAQGLQLPLIGDGALLSLISCQNHAAHKEAVAAEGVDQTQNIHVIGDAQVSADLVLLNVIGIDDQDDLHVLPNLDQHVDLRIGPESRKNPGGVIVIKQLAAEFQIELSSKLSDPFADALRLHLQISVIVKPDFKHPVLLFRYPAV